MLGLRYRGIDRDQFRRTAGADVNLMLEHVWLQYLSTAPVNVAVPNPEWFDRHDQRFLAQIDNVAAVKQALDAGLVINVTAENVIRMLPPLTIGRAELDRAVERLDEVPVRFRYADVNRRVAESDLVVYVSHWYERVARLGFGAFSEPFSNYTPPYLYLLWAASLLGGDAPAIPMIKLVAVVGGVWFSFSLFRLFRTLGVRDAGLAALASLLLPSIVLNVSLLGQADTFWVAACVLALTAAIEGRLPQVAFWSGVAFAFKAQAIFFAPFVMHFFVVRRAPIWCWLIPPAVYAAAMLPAWLASAPNTSGRSMGTTIAP